MSDSITSPLLEQSLPPLSNRGVLDTLDGTYFSIDWLRYSVPWPDGEIPKGGRDSILRAAVHPSPEIFFTGEYLVNPKGYDTSLALSHGRVAYHSEKPEQKIGVEFTGRALSDLKRLGVPALDLMLHAYKLHAKVTRLDLALDIFGRDADPVDVHRAFLAGQVKTRAQQVQLIEGKTRGAAGLESNGVTVYVGSRSSDKFLRVYDKAREQGLEGHKWTRLELVLAGDTANLFAVLVDAIGVDEVVPSAIKDFCSIPTLSWYTDALESTPIKIPSLPHKPTARKRWLLDQVLPALKAELVESELQDDWEVYEAFQSVMEIYRNREGR